jgi:hypothetical protein
MIHKPWLNPGGRIVKALIHNSRNFPMKKLAAAVLICLLATACASQSDLSGPYAHSSAAGGTRSDAAASDSQPASTLNDSFHYPPSN